MIRALAAAAIVVALAGCSSTTVEPPPESPAWQVTELPLPAVTAPPEATADSDPAPQISVEVTTEAPNPPASAPRVEKSVTTASASYANTLVSLANDARAQAGLPALTVNSCAAKAARARAARALAKESLEHEPLPDCGSGWTGENLARHYGTPKDMHEAWMKSAGHRENILRAEFTGIGVGCVAYSRKNPQAIATRSDDVGGQVCSQVFVG